MISPSDIQINDFINKLIKKQSELISNPEKSGIELENNKSNFLNNLKSTILSIRDIVSLCIQLKFLKGKFSNKKFAFIHLGFVDKCDNYYEDKIYKATIEECNIVYIAYTKSSYINKIHDSKVYNIGPFVNLIYKLSFFRFKKNRINFFQEFKWVNTLFLQFMTGQEVYTPCYYDINGFSLIFNKHREKYKLVEFQHASVLNYPTYSFQTLYKLVDVVYVKNQRSLNYLNQNLYKKYKPEFRLMKTLRNENLILKDKVTILYASSIETKGFHPVFLNFLKETTIKKLNIIVRLHPREKEMLPKFETVLQSLSINYQIDHSKSWLLDNTVKNLIVISPWSSIIEEAYDNDFIVFIIDSIGKKRYSDLIDNKKCIFTEDIEKKLNQLNIT